MGSVMRLKNYSTTTTVHLVSWLLICWIRQYYDFPVIGVVNGFTSTSTNINIPNRHLGRPLGRPSISTGTLPFLVRAEMGGNGNGSGNGSSSSTVSEYSREIRLREEAESPFRKVRFWVYSLLIGGAVTSLFISVTRIAAALSGINVDLMEESVVNALVDGVGIGVVSWLLQQDLASQESRLKRASKGASLARLKLRMSSSNGNGNSSVIPISSFRSGRGIEKRIVIAIGSRERMSTLLEEVSIRQAELRENDLVLVPVVYPQCTAPLLGVEWESLLATSNCLALPTGGVDWASVVNDEADEASAQGVDVTTDGIGIVLKKNGRVGTRTKGIYLDRMVGDVVGRAERGMDVKNI